jgi:hypothetical protein
MMTERLRSVKMSRDERVRVSYLANSFSVCHVNTHGRPPAYTARDSTSAGWVAA